MNPYTQEIKPLLEMLIAANFNLVAVHDGEERILIEGNNIETTIKHITSVDESHLVVRHINAERNWVLFIVLGNSPGEVVCDYTARPELEAVVSAHSDKWSK